MILLDYRDKRPIYEQMVEKLERLIVSGGLEQDSKMPSVRNMAVELAVNPNTVQRAYTLLEQEGYLYTVSGRGSFVVPEREWRDGQLGRMLAEWVAMTHKARDAGLSQEVLLEQLAAVYGHAGAENEESPCASALVYCRGDMENENMDGSPHRLAGGSAENRQPADMQTGGNHDRSEGSTEKL